MITKICSTCNEEKYISSFYKRSSSSDGYQGQCKECMRESIKNNKKKYRESEHGKQKEREYKQSEKYKEYCKEYRKRDNVKEKSKEHVKNYSQSEKGKKKIEEYQNSDRAKELRKISIEKRKVDGRRSESLKRYNNKMKDDPKFKLNKRLSTAIRYSLNNETDGNKWEEEVGYTRIELKKHLESKFTDEMDWDKFKNGEIQIDHIMPKTNFIFESPEDEEFKKCWDLNNLQPLFAKDNMTKGIKLDWEGCDYHR